MAECETGFGKNKALYLCMWGPQEKTLMLLGRLSCSKEMPRKHAWSVWVWVCVCEGVFASGWRSWGQMSSLSHALLRRHQQRVDVLKALEFGLVDLPDDVPENETRGVRRTCSNDRTCELRRREEADSYSSSGVSWMGSLVNWASKLSSPNSPEMLGLNGGTTCFCSSWNDRKTKTKITI